MIEYFPVFLGILSVVLLVTSAYFFILYQGLKDKCNSYEIDLEYKEKHSNDYYERMRSVEKAYDNLYLIHANYEYLHSFCPITKLTFIKAEVTKDYDDDRCFKIYARENDGKVVDFLVPIPEMDK